MEKKNGDWTIKGTEKIFENEFFKVYNDKVIQPDGKDGEYATIEFVEGVSVLPIDDDGLVYLTRQFRYAVGRESLETVAGGIEDEEPLEAAKREAREELGIEAGEWIPLGAIDADTSILKAPSHQFIARKLSFRKPERDDTEEMESVKMKLDEAVQKVLDGEITHAPSCVLLLKAAISQDKK
jgi:8-oxo-dGTP pyrophosphatase MutT (NUDIX family)